MGGKTQPMNQPTTFLDHMVTVILVDFVGNACGDFLQHCDIRLILSGCDGIRHLKDRLVNAGNYP